MRTIKILTLLIFCICLVGCQYEKKRDGFLVKGNVKGLNNSELVVLKFVDGGMDLDTITVTNNTFEYAGKVKEPYFVQFLIKKGFFITNYMITIYRC